MRNPNHYGSIVKLSGARRRPFMVRGGVYGYDKRGYPQFDIIGYAATREEGNMMLAENNRDPWDIDIAKITLGDLFKLWKEKKALRLGSSNRAALCSAFNYCSKLVNIPYRRIKAYRMQDVIDGCGKGPLQRRGGTSALGALRGAVGRYGPDIHLLGLAYF